MLNDGSNRALEPWFRVHPQRFKADRDGLEAHDFVLDAERLAAKNEVVYIGSLPEYPERKLEISFPSGYPSIPPHVVDDGNCDRLPRHQRPANRAYCLFGPNNEAWSARKFAVNVLAETKRVIDYSLGKLEGIEQVEDLAPEPFSAQAIFGNLGMVMVPPGISEMLPDDRTAPAEGIFTLIKNDGSGRGIVVKAEFSAPLRRYEANEGYRKMVIGPAGSKGRLIFLPSLEQPILDGNDLVSTFQKFNLPTHAGLGWCAVIFPEQYGTSRSSRFSWLLFRYKGKEYTPVQTITYRPAERGARIPGLEFLADKKIGLLGCGSIGSKIAAALAAAGARAFVLIDKEAMEPANSVRHECGINYFGFSKAHSLANLLTTSQPDLVGNCQPFCANPFGFGDTQREEVILALQGCDLIVDAAGNQLLSRAIAEVATAISRPMVAVSVTNGAWTGEIFRYVPKTTACWICHQSVIDEPPPGMSSPEGVYGPGCDQPTFTGAGHELDVVAGLAASFIVDTLRLVDGSESEYEGDYLLWEGRDSQGKLLQRTSVHRVQPRESCWQCQA